MIIMTHGFTQRNQTEKLFEKALHVRSSLTLLGFNSRVGRSTTDSVKQSLANVSRKRRRKKTVEV